MDTYIGRGHDRQIHKIADNRYLISWCLDTSRAQLRWPRRVSRETDHQGALRFCRSWGLELPP
jgi:hypothetical protein